MSQPLSDYFAQEAGEFLDHLDALLARPDAPDPVEFFRQARGVRGSAQIAGAEQVARVAERLEDGARALRDGLLQWSDEVRDRARRTVEDLRVLVAAHERGGDDARAGEAAARWDGVDAGRRRNDQPRSGDQLFDFLRREIVGVVGEMDRALQAMQADPAAKEPLRTVLRRMRPVRGVAGMDTLAPVLEALEGIEDAAHDVLGRPGPAGGRQMELLAAGRDALGAAGKALESSGAVGETPELARFRELRERAEGEDASTGEEGVVPISRFFFEDAGPHVLSSPLAPVGEQGRHALAEDVEAFLRIEATGFLDRAEGMVASLARRPARFARIARELAELAAGVGDLAVTYGMTMIAQAADAAVERLARSGSADEARAVLRQLRTALPGAAPLAETAVEVEPETGAPAAASASALTTASAVEEDGVVPVEALLYDPEDALREALAMRPRLEAAARGTPLGEALDELFSLVERGLGARAAA
jgi:HPt (histidine-containing phosphotransfer) domain-containing protein